MRFRSVLSIFGFVTGFVIVLGQATAFGAPASLQSLDQILQRAPNLEAFLNQPQWVEDYFIELQRYYGKDHFPRESFDAILKQLRETITQVPELSARLWETGELGTAFLIRASTKNHGRDLAVENWNDFLKEWKKRIREKGSRIIEISDPDLRRNELLRASMGIDAQIAQFELTLVGLKRAEQNQKRIAFFKNLRESTQVREVTSAFIYERLVSEQMNDLFRSGNSDLILQSLEALKEEPGRQNLGEWNLFPARVVSLVREQIPAKRELLARTDIFPISTRLTRDGKLVPLGTVSVAPIEFIPLPRRLHGIWKGVALGECVGGRCTELQNLTPERWATVALHKSQIHHLERDGNYLGFIQQTPVKVGEKIYGTVDFGASILNSNATVHDPLTGANKKSTLFEFWLKEASKRKPPEWSGLVVGESDAINNAGALGTVRSSQAYLFGKEIGEARHIQHFDPIAKKLIAVSPPVPYDYSGNMILEGTTPDSGFLHRLLVLDHEIEIADLIQNKKKRDAIMTRGSRAMKQALFRAWRQTEPLPRNVSRLKELLNDSDPLNRWLAVEESGELAKNSEIVAVFLEKLLDDTSPEVREAIARRLKPLIATQEEQMVLALARALQDPSRTVRIQAAETLVEIYEPRRRPKQFDASVLPDLRSALVTAMDDSEGMVRANAALVLQSVVKDSPKLTSDSEIVRVLVQHLGDSSSLVRAYSARALMYTGTEDRGIHAALTKLFWDPNPGVRRYAAMAFSNLGFKNVGLESLLALAKLSSDSSPAVRQTVLWSMKPRTTDPTLRRTFLNLLNDPNLYVRLNAIQMAEKTLPDDTYTPDLEVIEILVKATQDPEVQVRRGATDALGKRTSSDLRIRNALLRLLEDSDFQVKESSITALGNWTHFDAEVVAALEAKAQDSTYSLNSLAKRVIEEIREKNAQTTPKQGCLAPHLVQIRGLTGH